jgi:ergothioneine biosynthesis protein EgtB
VPLKDGIYGAIEYGAGVTGTKTSRPAKAGLKRLEEQLPERFVAVRQASLDLGARLSDEDQTPQSMTDASPAKWHLAHTSWFFEVMLLEPFLEGYTSFHPKFTYLFNSYYETVGARHERPKRGLLTRPSASEIRDYRAYVDAAMERLFDQAPSLDAVQATADLVELGIAHEEQHQELLLTDILHLFSMNTLNPAFQSYRPIAAGKAPALGWIDFEGGIVEIGDPGDGFAFDNEGPRHDVLLRPFKLATRPVTAGEYIAFMADDGYRRPELWMSDGWATVQEFEWTAPLYWQMSDGVWHVMSLSGLQEVNTQAPVSHVSYYEADAYARWAGARLPSETEWETAAASDGVAEQMATGNFRGAGLLRPRPAGDGDGLQQMFGDVWEWTSSAYAGYPGFAPVAGAVGEYNGKFMSNQMVLRGGSCVTPNDHVRASYRNFFYPHQRWQFMGLRLACDG